MDNTQKLQKMFWQLNLYFQAHFCPIVSEDVLQYCENNCIQPFYKTINDYLKRQGLTKRQTVKVFIISTIRITISQLNA